LHGALLIKTVSTKYFVRNKVDKNKHASFCEQTPRKLGTSAHLPVTLNKEELTCRKQSQYQLTPLILVLHLSHVGAKYFSKQYSQYSSPFSSTKPMSASGRRHWALTHTKWSGHQFLPSAVMNGPLEDVISIILDQLTVQNTVTSPT
jgi:hypothetical protein